MSFTYSNPYFDAYNEAMKNCPPGMERIFDPSLSNEQRQLLFEWNCQYYDRLRKQYSYAVPTDEILSIIATFEPLIEFAAGTGYWSYLLQQRNIQIEPFDNKPLPLSASSVPQLSSTSSDQTIELIQDTNHSNNENNHSSNISSNECIEDDEKQINIYHPSAISFCEVKQASPSILSTYSSSYTLFLCWLPDNHNDETNQYDVGLDLLRNYQGEYICYIGESIDRTLHNEFGLVGGIGFHFYLNQYFHEILRIQLPNWPGCMDCLSIYKRTQLLQFNDQIFKSIPLNERLNDSWSSEIGKQIVQSAAQIRRRWKNACCVESNSDCHSKE